MATFKIEKVEGIGAALVEQFNKAGIVTTTDLRERAKTPQGRQALAEATGLTEVQILKFANIVDLFRIPGLSADFAALMEAAGIDCVAELAKRNPEILTKRLATVNQECDLSRYIPSLKDVTRWVEQAKALPRVIEP